MHSSSNRRIIAPVLGILAALLWMQPVHGQDILICDFQGTAPGQNTPWTGVSYLDSEAAFSGWQRGGTVFGTGLDDAFTVQYNAPTTFRPEEDFAFENDNYIGFTIGPAGAQPLDIANKRIEFTIRRTASWSPPIRFYLCTSTEGFSAHDAIYTSPVLATDDLASNDFMAYTPAGYDALTGDVEFRIYLSGGTGTGPVALEDFRIVHADSVPMDYWCTQAHPDDGSKSDEHCALMGLFMPPAATHTAIQSGEWFAASTWNTGTVPNESARVFIPGGIEVTYTGESDTRIDLLRVNGDLTFATHTSSRLILDSLFGMHSSTLRIGDHLNPVEDDVTVRIIFADNGPIDTGWDYHQLSRGLVTHGAVRIHGAPKTTFLRVAQDPMAGATQLMLEEEPENWSVGDRLVLTGTYYVPDTPVGGGDAIRNDSQDEELTIVAINGTEVTFSPALQHDHDTPRPEFKAYVANFSRNVIFETENHESLPSNQRAHTMFMHNANIDVRYAEFFELGRTDKSFPLDDFALTSTDPYTQQRIYDINGDAVPGLRTNIRGRYSAHFHRSGTDSFTQPALFIGNSVWGSPGWGVVHHDSYAILEDNACYNAFGACFMSETGNEIGSWRRNIAIRSPGRVSHAKEGTQNHDVAQTGSGFWLQGRLVECEGNVAAGAGGQGFMFFLRGVDQLYVHPEIIDRPETGRYQSDLDTNIPIIQHFTNNEAFCAMFGLDIIKANEIQGHDQRSVLEDFVAWEVKWGAELEYTGQYTMTDFLLVGARNGNGYEGINLGNNAVDMVFVRAEIDGFYHGVHYAKINTHGVLADHHYVLIDTTLINNNTDFEVTAPAVFDPATELVLSSGDLPNLPLSLSLGGLTDLHASAAGADRRIRLVGTKSDMLGNTDYPRGHDLYEMSGYYTISRMIYDHGYYQATNGDPRVALIDEIVADRVTGEMLKLTIPFTIDANWGNLDGERYFEAPPTNNRPLAVKDDSRVQMNQDVVIDLLGNDSDADGEALSIVSISTPLNGQVQDLGGGQIEYTPDNDFAGFDGFSYTVMDTSGGTDTARIHVMVDATYEQDTGNAGVSDWISLE